MHNSRKILAQNKFDLIINSETQNKISKKIFFKRITKDYKSVAFTTIVKHQKCRNNKAVQIFTSCGPLAFLPYSNTETSIVFSVLDEKKNKSEKEIKELIIKKYLLGITIFFMLKIKKKLRKHRNINQAF